MHFLYLDGSGDTGRYDPIKHLGSQFRYYVLGGVTLDTNHWYPLKQSLAKVMTAYFGANPPEEIHFSQIRRKKKPFNKVNATRLMDDLVAAVASSPSILFAIAIDKQKWQSKYAAPPHIPTFCLDAITSRFQEYLRRCRTQGAVLSDRSHYKNDDVLLKAFETMKKDGTRFVPVNRVMDTIFFTPSETALGIQVADIVANVVFRHLERGDSKYFKQLYGSFDHYQGKMHGFRLYPP